MSVTARGALCVAGLLVSVTGCESRAPAAAPAAPKPAPAAAVGAPPVETAPPPAPAPALQPSVPAQAQAATDAPPAAAPGADIAARTFAGTNLSEDLILQELSSAALIAIRPVGSTSTVFKTTLKSTVGAAFKAATKKRPRGPHSEIAAYRLARCLGLHNVPPAISRRIPVGLLHSDIDAEHAAAWPAIQEGLVIDPDKRVLGAAVYWIEGMQNLGLESDAGQARVAAWLSLSNELPSEERALAAQASTLLAFDYLIGNWDRWSGGNVKGDATGKVLYMRDHDASFAARLSEPLLRRMLDPLVRAQRFSRAFYLALRALSREAFVAELARDPGFAKDELLDKARIEGMFERREALLSHIMASIEEHGEVKVLAFP